MSPSTDRDRYVFVSCLMSDTCGAVVKHLINYLKIDGIGVVIGTIEIGPGEPMNPTLRRSIEDCDIYVIFFSENYATSNSRLWEVKAIAEAAEAMGKKILPVFHGVTVEDVKLKTSKYRTQLSQHTTESVVTTKEWRKALRGIAQILGLNRSTSPDLCQQIRGRVLDLIKEKDQSAITLEATISGCPNLLSLKDLGLGSTSRTLLRVDNCGIETLFSEFQPRNMTEKITIRNCHKLKEFPLVQLKSLKKLDIKGCTSIESLSDVASAGKLEELSIVNCPNLKVIEGFEKVVGSLKCLNIHNCGSLERVDCDYDSSQTLKHPNISSCNSQNTLIISPGEPNEESKRNNSTPTDSSSISTSHDEVKIEMHHPESSLGVTSASSLTETTQQEDAEEELTMEELDRLIELD